MNHLHKAYGGLKPKFCFVTTSHKLSFSQTFEMLVTHPTSQTYLTDFYAMYLEAKMCFCFEKTSKTTFYNDQPRYNINKKMEKKSEI